jgi:hypothetical protein
VDRENIRKRGRTTSGHAIADGRDKDWFLIVFGLLAAALYLKGIVRVSVTHTLASLIPSLMLLAVLLERALHQRRMVQIVVGVICALTLAFTLPVAFAARFRFLGPSSVLVQVLSSTTPRADKIETTWCGTPKDLERVACFLIGSDREHAVRFLVHNTTAEERIFVGLTKHDKIVVNDNVTYFAAARLPATKWHHFDPGLQTRADVQTEIIDALEARSVRYVVLTSEWNDIMEPNDSAKSSGVYILDDYIRQHYRPVRTYGRMSIWFRDIDSAPTRGLSDQQSRQDGETR